MSRADILQDAIASYLERGGLSADEFFKAQRDLNELWKMADADEIAVLKEAGAWLSCEVDGHGEKCTCGSCVAISKIAHLYKDHGAYSRFERIKERVDKAMAALAEKTSSS